MEFLSKKLGGGGSDTCQQCSSDPSSCMRAVVYEGGKSLKVEHVPRPKIMEPHDAIIKVTACSVSPDFAAQASAGEVEGMEKGQIVGSEAVGVVDKLGSDVSNLSLGDRVAISFVIACGTCSYCKRQEFSACNCTNESRKFKEWYGGWAPAAVFGSTSLFNNIPGSQAEYVRVPFADVNCFKVPQGVPDEQAVFAGETAVCGLYATELAAVKRDSNVVIWGLGPVGLMAAKWSKLKGANRVIGIDHNNDRLKFARDRLHIDVVDRTKLSCSEVINKVQALLPEGGADSVIDASGTARGAGMVAKLEKSMGMEPEPIDTFKEIFTLARKFGHVGVISTYVGFVDGYPIGHAVLKDLTVRNGRTPAQKYMKQVLQAMESGELDPSELISHRMSLDELAHSYGEIGREGGGFLKVVAHPHQV